LFDEQYSTPGNCRYHQQRAGSVGQTGNGVVNMDQTGFLENEFPVVKATRADN